MVNRLMVSQKIAFTVTAIFWVRGRLLSFIVKTVLYRAKIWDADEHSSSLQRKPKTRIHDYTKFVKASFLGSERGFAALYSDSCAQKLLFSANA